MSVVQRIREIVHSIATARFPPPPKRRYDLIGEAMTRPFGGSGGRDPVRAGGVVDEDEASSEQR